MAEFTPGKTVQSREPTVRVDTLLEPGRYRFQLVVIDDQRNASEPAELTVSVRSGLQPTAAATRGDPGG